MTAARRVFWAIAASLVGVCLVPAGIFLVIGPVPMRGRGRQGVDAVVSYCVEPAPPRTLATFAPCREVIADSVWPL